MTSVSLGDLEFTPAGPYDAWIEFLNKFKYEYDIGRDAMDTRDYLSWANRPNAQIDTKITALAALQAFENKARLWYEDLEKTQRRMISCVASEMGCTPDDVKSEIHGWSRKKHFKAYSNGQTSVYLAARDIVQMGRKIDFYKDIGTLPLPGF